MKSRRQKFRAAGSAFPHGRVETVLRRNYFCVVLFSVLLAAGCSKYNPVPLPPPGALLGPPDMAGLRILASTIKHPILKPVLMEPERGLSPDEAAVLAVLLNPSLRSVRDERLLAEAQLLEAGLLPNPDISFAFETPIGGDTGGAVNAFGFELTWDISALISRSARVSQAKNQSAAVNLDIAWQEWQIAQAAKGAVYKLASLKAQMSLAEETERRLAESLRLIQKAVNVGTRAAKDLFAAEAASMQAKAELLDLQKQTTEQQNHLKQLLGLPTTAEIRLKDEIALPSHFDLPSASDLFEGLEYRRLDLVALRYGYYSQEAAVRTAVLNQFPKIGIGPTVGRDIEDVDTAGFTLTISLPVFNRNQGRIAIEQATRQKLFDEYVNRIFQTRSDIEMILSRLRFLNEQVGAARSAESALRMLVEKYRIALAEGRTDAFTYYSAWHDLTNIRIKTAVLKGQMAEAVVALELAAGMYRIPPPKLPTTAPSAR